MSGRPCEICSAMASSETDGLGAPTLARASAPSSDLGGLDLGGLETAQLEGAFEELSLGQALAGAQTRRVLIEDRLLSLCDEHAAEVQMAQVTGIDELRELFRERFGARSLVPRRTPLDRRIFPARPEGRRLAGGRRASDQG